MKEDMIQTFDDLYDAILMLEVEAEQAQDYFKGEILKLDNGKYRVGIIFDAQMELPLDD